MMACAIQKDEVLDEGDQSFQNAVAVLPLFARSVAAELREASDQVGTHHHLLRLHKVFLRNVSLFSCSWQKVLTCPASVSLSTRVSS